MNVPSSQQSIQNYLAWSIIATVLATCFCCPIGLLGIVAIVFSSQVNSKLAQGDIDGARRASEQAKIWCWVATGLAIVGLLINIGFLAMGGTEQYLEYLKMAQQQQ